MNTLKCSLMSVGFVVLSAGWAAAAPAVVLDYLNLRYAPGYDQYIIEVIQPGWVVNTGACADGWCSRPNVQQGRALAGLGSSRCNSYRQV